MKICRVRIITIICLVIITPLGFIFKFYSGPFYDWVNNNAAGMLYEIFWILLFFLFFPGYKTINRIPAIVFVITVLLEFMQLWHPPFLESIRHYFMGRTLVGTSFSWLDILHYFFGCLLGWLLLKFIIHKRWET
jgi:hypothetical protein